MMSKVKKSAAQKQREYRARQDSDHQRRAQYLEKERSSWAKKKADKKWQPMASLSEDKCSRRRKNGEAQARYRHHVASAAACTPPATPSASVQDLHVGSVRESP